MLDPNSRTMYTASLAPPPGMIFDLGIATTFSLDLTTLLTVPLHLTLTSSDDTEELLHDGVALLEGLRRTTRKLTVFCQQGQIAVPNIDHVLYGLLEPIIKEIRLPRTGVFHPKIWLLRYVDPEEINPPLLRLLVLSRNLTADRSWDISLVIEGVPSKRNVPENAPLFDLLMKLNKLCRPKLPEDETLKKLASQARKTTWELPLGYDKIIFHTPGLPHRPWSLPSSDELVTISPFCSTQALQTLAKNTRNPVALISRAEELENIDTATREMFNKIYVLDEAAESEEGEDLGLEEIGLRGLHAKAYVMKRGWNTHTFIGSANATDAALTRAQNVEILAELVGRSSRVGLPAKLLDPEALGELLVEFSPAENQPPDEEAAHAEKVLEQAKKALGTARPHLECATVEGNYQLQLSLRKPQTLSEIDTLKAWPVTLKEGHAVEALPITAGESVALSPCALASLTSLIAFEFTTEKKYKNRFVLNVPITGLPALRDAAILKTIISNRSGFLRYLLLLLSEPDPTGQDTIQLGKFFGFGQGKNVSSLEYVPLLEEMARAFSRDQDKLRSIGRLVEDLEQSEEGKEILPDDFRDLWQVFKQALKGETGE